MEDIILDTIRDLTAAVVILAFVGTVSGLAYGLIHL